MLHDTSEESNFLLTSDIGRALLFLSRELFFGKNSVKSTVNGLPGLVENDAPWASSPTSANQNRSTPRACALHLFFFRYNSQRRRPHSFRAADTMFEAELRRRRFT